MKAERHADDVRRRAKAMRELEIRLLTACTCAYPLVRYRNGSGHHPACPSYSALGDGPRGEELGLDADDAWAARKTSPVRLPVDYQPEWERRLTEGEYDDGGEGGD